MGDRGAAATQMCPPPPAKCRSWFGKLRVNVGIKLLPYFAHTRATSKFVLTTPYHTDSISCQNITKSAKMGSSRGVPVSESRRLVQVRCQKGLELVPERSA